MLIKRKSIEQVESSRPARKPRYAPVTLSEMDGVRYLHFGTEWVRARCASASRTGRSSNTRSR